MDATPTVPAAAAGHPASGHWHRRRSPLLLDQTAGVIAQLNRDWLDLQTQPSTTTALARWSDQHPALSGLLALVDIEAAVACGAPDDVDAVLHTLLSVAQSTDPTATLAARIVLQLMIPRAVAVARGQQQLGERRDRDTVAVSCLYEVIRGYPLRRRRHVAANLAMELLAAVRRAALAETCTVVDQDPGLVPWGLIWPAAADAGTGRGGDRTSARQRGDGPPAHRPGRRQSAEPQTRTHRETSPSEQLVRLLIWAVQTEVLDRADADLLARRYSPPSRLLCTEPGRSGPRSVADAALVAAEVGLSPATVRARCSRAIRRLAAAAADYDEVAAAS